MSLSDQQRVEIIYSYASKLDSFVKRKNIQLEDILFNEEVQWCISTPLSQIGVNAKHLSQHFRETYAEIPWLRIAGLRDRLAHEYGGINWNIVAEAVLNDIPELVSDLNIILHRTDGDLSDELTVQNPHWNAALPLEKGRRYVVEIVEKIDDKHWICQDRRTPNRYRLDLQNYENRLIRCGDARLEVGNGILDLALSADGKTVQGTVLVPRQKEAEMQRAALEAARRAESNAKKKEKEPNTW